MPGADDPARTSTMLARLDVGGYRVGSKTAWETPESAREVRARYILSSFAGSFDAQLNSKTDGTRATGRGPRENVRD